METRNMKVGEVYRYKYGMTYIVKIVSVHEYRIQYKYLDLDYNLVESYEKEMGNDDVVLLTKLHRLLEGLDENIRISGSKTSSTGKRRKT